MHPADAKREIEDAVATARAHDHELRARAVALAGSRVEAAHRLEVATTEADDARTLAKRALGRANESARAGQRADAAKWTGAAQVFAMRLRDARAVVADAEALAASWGSQRQQLDAALGGNVGRLQALVAARLPMMGGRKAARSQALVDEAVAELSVPVTDIVARAEAETRAALAAADEAGTEAEEAAEVAVDDLEREVDFASTDDILDELRAELGLPTVGPTADAENGATSSEAAPLTAAGSSEQPGTDDVAPASPAGSPPVRHASGARS